MTGLDYNVLFYRLDRLQLNPEQHEQLFQDVRSIEIEALAAVHQNSA
jgi:hypothetical protein